MTVRLAGVVALGLAAVACLSSPTAPRGVPLGQEFELGTGEAAVFDDDLRVTFERVVSDSRCPADALCVWAGDAVVRIGLARSAWPSARAELHTAAGSEGSVSYPGFDVRLVRVAPYPRSSSTIPAEDYRATLVVTRQATPALP